MLFMLVTFMCIVLADDERSSKEQDALATLCITDVDTTLHYVNQWIQRYNNSSDLCMHVAYYFIFSQHNV